jgi:hypothetical protein
MSDSTFTNGNFLDTNEKNGSFQNSIAVNSVGTEEQQNPREISNKLVILTFGDIHKNQFTIARLILNQYILRAVPLYHAIWSVRILV